MTRSEHYPEGPHPESAGWSVESSTELYHVDAWGGSFFSINEKGNVQVHPYGKEGHRIDLKELVEEIEARGIQLPILVRFTDILKQRVKALHESFDAAIQESGYKGRYMGVYPVKVNHQRHVVREIVTYGAPYQYGLEAGSKPELFAVLALLQDPEPLIICNGYKDDEFLEMVILATKMGKTVFPVVEKFSELRTIIALAKKHGVRQPIGLRAKLASRGTGRWLEYGGDRSKFGLTISEILKAQRLLEEEGMLDMLQLLHFHIGSQINTVRAIRKGMQEAVRIFAELHKLGANLKYIDVGGGLAIDYDGSKTESGSSVNYTLEEYASAVVWAVMEGCDDEKVPHPVIISESGRAITAQQSVLIFNVLGLTCYGSDDIPENIPDEENVAVIEALMDVYRDLSQKNVQASYHEAQDARDEALSLFSLGYLSLAGRAAAENIYWAICQRILNIVREMEYVPEELAGLEKTLASTYICNFSAFQSVPDFWAVQQLFPIMPIHRLNEYPSNRGILGDLTCDSDGKIDRFINLGGVKDVLELHSLNDDPYYLGVFMVGAYQETLGDLHNLFGDTNAVHVRVDPKVGYRIDHVIKGDTVTEVLGYVQFSSEELLNQMRQLVERSVRRGLISFSESAQFLRRYEEGLAGYTYTE